MSRKPLFLMLPATLAAGLASVTATAWGGEVQRGWSAANGASAQVERQHEPGASSRDVVRTGPAGGSTTRHYERSVDPGGEGYQSSRSVTHTGAQGQSVTRSREVERGGGVRAQRTLGRPRGRRR